MCHTQRRAIEKSNQKRCGASASIAQASCLWTNRGGQHGDDNSILRCLSLFSQTCLAPLSPDYKASCRVSVIASARPLLLSVEHCALIDTDLLRRTEADSKRFGPGAGSERQESSSPEEP